MIMIKLSERIPEEDFDMVVKAIYEGKLFEANRIVGHYVTVDECPPRLMYHVWGDDVYLYGGQ